MAEFTRILLSGSPLACFPRSINPERMCPRSLAVGWTRLILRKGNSSIIQDLIWVFPRSVHAGGMEEETEFFLLLPEIPFLERMGDRRQAERLLSKAGVSRGEDENVFSRDLCSCSLEFGSA